MDPARQCPETAEAGSDRHAARRTVARHAEDVAELAVLLDMLDLRPDVDHLYRGVDADLRGFNDA
ncbi:hypothetical protein ACWDYJ_10280 [Streptomyces sp. NPDC003042]